MLLLDRFVVGRFLGSFVLLFGILFLLAVSLDVILQIDEFVDAAKRAMEAGRYETLAGAISMAVLNFHGPRFFQFYGFMLGLTSVAAMGFTLASMVKHRELVALMSAGVGLVRVGLAIILGAFALNLLGLVNSEVLVPRLAPLLLREHNSILAAGVREYEVPLTRDAANALLRASSFDPKQGRLSGVLIIRRDEAGRASERITAAAATYEEEPGGWRLEGGESIVIRAGDEPVATGDRAMQERRPAEFFESDLSPKTLLVRRSAQYSQMLSLAEIAALRQGSGPEADVLARAYYGRFAQVAVNLLILVIALPCFLLREPRPLLGSSVQAAVIAVPGILGSIAIMTIEVPGLPPALSTFLPAAILLPVAVARLVWLRT